MASHAQAQSTITSGHELLRASVSHAENEINHKLKILEGPEPATTLAVMDLQVGGRKLIG